MQKLREFWQKHLIRPLLESPDSLSQVSWGMAIGTAVALLPIIGQMYLVIGIWLCARRLGYPFTLPVAMALTWVSNPITMPPFYYLCIVTGHAILEALGVKTFPLTYESFRLEFEKIAQQTDWGERLWETVRFMLIDLGEPLMTGLMLYGSLLVVAVYWLTHYALRRYRQTHPPVFESI